MKIDLNLSFYLITNNIHKMNTTNYDEMTSQETEMTDYNVDNIINDEYDFQDNGKIHHEHCFGVCHTVNDGELKLGFSISVPSLLNYDIKCAHKNLGDGKNPVCIDIMQLHTSQFCGFCIQRCIENILLKNSTENLEKNV